MSFETVIILGLSLLFVIAPMFGKKSRNEEKKPPPGPRRQPGTAQPQGQEPAPSQESGDWQSRLEEARRRIEAALSEDTAQVPGQQQTQQTPPPRTVTRPSQARSATVRTATATRQQAATATRQQAAAPSVDWQSVTKFPASPQAAAAAAARRKAAAERTRRLRESRSSEVQVTTGARQGTYTVRRRKVDAGELFSTDSVLSGYIWHQILSEPPHKRGNRRKVSRLRSP